MTDKSDCKGCITILGCYVEVKEECPCRSCIVKMICDESCQPYNDFVESAGEIYE